MSVLKVHINEAGYKTNEIVIKDIKFEIKPGELVGLLGPNGAGKSTTIKGLIGTLEYINGTIEFDQDERRYAYIPEQPVFYDDLTMWEHFQFTASVCGMTDSEMEKRVGELLKIFRLGEVKHHLPRTFSKGMQQKLMIILAFLVRPSLYIIDEPFVGLDPRAIRDFLKLLEAERENGASVLMSTHVLDTAERICDRFLLIAYGEMIANGDMKELQEMLNLPDAALFDCFEQLLEDNDHD
ncbi:ABC transporter ATP-binding protein [Halalkalibacillus sediminis]|uniref:ABC transporter ATP-binding protein n=1 Tax=Halalkalibacillus sediminis TaxID=2018042 RepID=A0A2I0QTH0_9BACI|nr:ABC transporter ATP-binding protein [Halalkalibacillus sediminis]PKR77598.1 ABC transporter ATP-binding protein [Halalkalibacillus sediminis]